MDSYYEKVVKDSGRHPLLRQVGYEPRLITERGTSNIAKLMCAGRGLPVDLAGPSTCMTSLLNGVIESK